jgi:hypothetical protein
MVKSSTMRYSSGRTIWLRECPLRRIVHECDGDSLAEFALGLDALGARDLPFCVIRAL